MKTRLIEVGAAVIRRGDGKILICSRPKKSALGDFFEFPGGKFEPGETPAQCIEREIREELGIGIRVGEKITAIEHDYGDKYVHVSFYWAEMTDPSAELLPLDGQEFKWVAPKDLPDSNLLPADQPVAELLATVK